MSKNHEESESFAVSDDDIQMHVATSHANLLGLVINNHGVRKAINKAIKAGISWADILAVIIPLLGGIFSGGTLDWQAIIAAILALINKHEPATA